MGEPEPAAPRPVTRGVARRDIDGQRLLWRPWSPPVLLDGRAAAILDALDGSPLAELAAELADLEGRPTPEAEAELAGVARHLRWHGLLADSPTWARPQPAVLHRDLTICDRTRYRYDEADVFDLRLARRRITVAVADQGLAAELRAHRALDVTAATEPIAEAALELVVTPADRPRGFHHLYGRSGRVYARSLDRADVVRALVTYLASLEWMDEHPELVWLDAFALVREAEVGAPGDVALLPGQARHLWPNLARRVGRAGYRPVDAVGLALDPATGHLVLPPPPAADLRALLTDLLASTAVDPTGRGLPPEAVDPSAASAGPSLPVTRIDDLVNAHEIEALRSSGQDPDDLSPALAALRLALLAHRGVADAHPADVPDGDHAHRVLATVASVAAEPGLIARLHGTPGHLLASLVD